MKTGEFLPGVMDRAGCGIGRGAADGEARTQWREGGQADEFADVFATNPTDRREEQWGWRRANCGAGCNGVGQNAGLLRGQAGINKDL